MVDDHASVPVEDGGSNSTPYRRFASWADFFRQYSRYLVSILLSIALTAVLLLLPLLLPSFDYEALGGYGYLGIFLSTLLPSATVIFPSPTLAAAWIGGTFLNPMWVGLLAGLGATIGEITGYLMGYGGSAMAERSRNYERIQRLVARYGLPVVFIFALIPNPLFDLTGIAAGTARMPVWRFLAVCFLGKAIRFILIAYLGSFWGVSG